MLGPRTLLIAALSFFSPGIIHAETQKAAFESIANLGPSGFYENFRKLPQVEISNPNAITEILVFTSLTCAHSERIMNIIKSKKYPISARFVLFDAVNDFQIDNLYSFYKFPTADNFVKALHGDAAHGLDISREARIATKQLSDSIRFANLKLTTGLGLRDASPLVIVYGNNGKINPVVGVPNFDAVVQMTKRFPSTTPLMIATPMTEILSSTSAFLDNATTFPRRDRVKLRLWPSDGAPYFTEIPRNSGVAVLGVKVVNGKTWYRIAPYVNRDIVYYSDGSD